MTFDPSLPNNTREAMFWCDAEMVYVLSSRDSMVVVPTAPGVWSQMCSECAESSAG